VDQRSGRYRFSWGDYTALSYARGNMTDNVDLILNGAVMEVRRNLEAALRIYVTPTGCMAKRYG
jgi:hypothetical protein